MAFKRLAGLISEKHGQPYSSTLNFIRCKISFSLIDSAIACLHGPRSAFHAPARELNLTDHPLDHSRRGPASGLNTNCIYNYFLVCFLVFATLLSHLKKCFYKKSGPRGPGGPDNITCVQYLLIQQFSAIHFTNHFVLPVVCDREGLLVVCECRDSDQS